MMSADEGGEESDINKNAAMADRCSTENMKQLSKNTDNYGDFDDQSVQGDCEEPRDPNYVEERFRVDRRKLESMLQQACDNEEQPAEEFFQKVMIDTDTHITWPSKLKIGAKSKKDPHIKVAGMKEAVAAAKDKILTVLDTKSNRVTLKMDVSHTDHSHVIGKGGNNIKRVMQETGCHIHFPDSNRGNSLEKSNQVSIAGQPNGVEQARARIRELLPLVFMFDLPITGVLQPVPDSSSPVVQQISNTYGVAVSFKQRPRAYVTTVVVRGSVDNAKAVKEATALLIENLTGNLGTTVPVSMQLEIAPQHHLFMIGRSGANIKQIMQRTGASIHFPDPNTSTPQRKGTVIITGAIESVFLARQQVIGCLPLVLMFDMKEDSEIDQGKISQLMEQLDVFISIKPKPKQPSKSVIVKSIERNAFNMYEARRQLLGLIGEMPPPVSCRSADTNSSGSAPANSLGLAGLGRLIGHNLLNINTNPLLMMNGAQSPLPSPHAGRVSSPAPLISAAPGLYGPMMVVQTAGCVSLPSAYNIYAQNGLTKDLNHNSALIRIPSASDRGAASGGSCSGSPSSDSPPQNSPIDLISHHQHAVVSVSGSSSPISPTVHSVKSCNNFADVMLPKKNMVQRSNTSSPADFLNRSPGSSLGNTSGLNTPQMAGTILPPASLSSSDLYHNSMLSTSGSRLRGYSSHASSMCSAPLSPQNLGLVLEDNLRNVPFHNGERRSSESGIESDGSDNRAPGSNRPIVPPPGLTHPGLNISPNSSTSSSLFSGNALFVAFEYEQKKLEATKAMQQKPDGERFRQPTSEWSGLGFSKSMPGNQIRERLKNQNVRKDPLPHTPYELDEDQHNEDDIDRDPWKDSRSVNPPMSPAPGGFPSHRHIMNSYNPLGSNHLDSVSARPPPGFTPKTDLAELFSKLGLGKYTDLFQQQEIDLSTFLTLTDQDLKELGITTFGARRKMLMAIADLNKKQTLMDAAPGSNNPFRDVSATAGVIGSQRRHDIASQSGRW